MITNPNYALFLDRDGVINKDKGYVHKIDDFEFNEEIFNLVRTARIYDLKVIIITNQSGISRGFYSQNDYQKLTNWMLGQFNNHEISILDTFYCPHSPESKCNCRKPKPGMVNHLIDKFALNREECLIIGDSKKDAECGINANINYVLLSTIYNNDDVKLYDTIVENLEDLL